MVSCLVGLLVHDACGFSPVGSVVDSPLSHPSGEANGVREWEVGVGWWAGSKGDECD